MYLAVGGPSNNAVDPAFVAEVNAALVTIQRRLDAAERESSFYFWSNAGMIIFVAVSFAALIVVILVFAPKTVRRWFDQWCANKASLEAYSKA